MSKYYVSVLTPSGIYKQYEVDQAVYIYVKQLETYIRNPEESNLREIYKERFGNYEEDDPFEMYYHINYSAGVNE